MRGQARRNLKNYLARTGIRQGHESPSLAGWLPESEARKVTCRVHLTNPSLYHEVATSADSLRPPPMRVLKVGRDTRMWVTLRDPSRIDLEPLAWQDGIGSS